MTTWLRSPKHILVFILWAALTGWIVGQLTLCLVNCVADPSEARLASISKIDRKERRVVDVTISEPYPGVTFCIQKNAWYEGEFAGKRFFVHMGRLGLVWGELR